MAQSHRRCLLISGLLTTRVQECSHNFIENNKGHSARWSVFDVTNMLQTPWSCKDDKGIIVAMQEAFISRAIGADLDIVLEISTQNVDKVIESINRWCEAQNRVYDIELETF